MSSPSSPYISEAPKKSWWDSLFGSAPAPASSPSPAPTSTPVGGRHRRKHTLKKAGRRKQKKGGDETWPDVSNPTTVKFIPAPPGPKWPSVPTKIRKGKGRRTLRGKKHSRK